MTLGAADLWLGEAREEADELALAVRVRLLIDGLEPIARSLVGDTEARGRCFDRLLVEQAVREQSGSIAIASDHRFLAFGLFIDKAAHISDGANGAEALDHPGNVSGFGVRNRGPPKLDISVEKSRFKSVSLQVRSL